MRALPAQGEAGGKRYTFRLVTTVEGALSELEHRYFNVLILDCRPRAGERRVWFTDGAPMQLLERIRASASAPLRFRSHRIIALLPESANLASETFVIGKYRLGGFVVPPITRERLFDAIERVIGVRAQGKAALCLAGGGAEGLTWTLGAAWALDACFAQRKITDFDVYCGNSSGALLAALMAQRATPADLFESLAGRGKSVASIDRTIFRPVTLRESAEFIRRVVALALTPLWLQRNLLDDVAGLMPTGFVSNTPLQNWMKKQLTAGGRSDDFREVQGRLYVGATELDTYRPVVFGDRNFIDVPISTAVAASCALVPVFSPVTIERREYVDAQFSSTANVDLAVRKGATLVVVINPVAPIAVDEPGYVRSRGGVFAGWQGFLALVNSRFEGVMEKLIEKHPEVDFVVLRPDRDEVRHIYRPAMLAAPRLDVVRQGYLSALRQLRKRRGVVMQDFARHGFAMHKEPLSDADNEAARLPPALRELAARA